MTGRAPNMTEKLAATLLAWLEALGAPIPREHAQAMSAAQIVSLFEFDHWPIRRIDGGTNHPDNLMPRFIAAHGVKTATIDVPQIAKRKRIVEKEAARTKVAMMPGPYGHLEVEFVIDDDNPRVARPPDPLRDPELYRPRPRPKATLRSRGFDKSKTRTFRGKVVARKQRAAISRGRTAP